VFHSRLSAKRLCMLAFLFIILSACNLPVTVTPAQETDDGMSLSVLSHSTSINAGGYADVSFSYQNVDPSLFTLYVEIKNASSVIGQESTTHTAATGNSSVRIPLDWEATAGSDYYVSVAAVSNSGGWDDPGTMIIDDTQLITLSVPVPFPSVTIVQADSQVTAGSPATIEIGYSNIPPSTSHQFLVYIMDASGASFDLELDVSGSGTQQLQIPLAMDTTAGSYRWAWAVVSRTDGWDSPMTIFHESEQYVLQIQANPDLPQITLTPAATSVAAGDYFVVDVAHQNVAFDRFELQVYLRSSSGVYEFVALPTAADGAQQLRIPMPWASAAAQDYVLGWAMVSLDAASSGQAIYSQELVSSPVTVTASSVALPQLSIDTYTQQIVSGNYLSVDISYSQVDFNTHSLQIVLRNAQETKSAMEIVQGDAQSTLTLNIPVAWQTQPCSDCYIELVALDKLRDGWSDPRTLVVKSAGNPVQISANSVAPPVLGISNFATTVNAGGEITATLTYSGVDFSTHDLLLELSDGQDVYARVQYAAVDALETSGEISVVLTVDANTPVANNYYLEATALDIKRDAWLDPMTISVQAGAISVSQ